MEIDIMQGENGREIPSSLNELCQKLSAAFVPIHVDLDLVNHLLLMYKSNPADWEAYLNFGDNVYKRNLVDAGNGKYNLVFIYWDAEQQSSIHDHSDSSCFIKILHGELTEVRYKNYGWCDNNHLRIFEIASNTIKTNDVFYSNHHRGLHQINNLSTTVDAISLHLYYPALPLRKVHKREPRFWY